MDSIANEIDELKAQQTKAEQEKAKFEQLLANKGIDKKERAAIHQRILFLDQRILSLDQRITAYVTKLPTAQRADIVVPFLGWTFPHTIIGVLEAYATILGVPMGLYWTWRFGRLSCFRYRHACVPYPEPVLVRYCQQYSLQLDALKGETDLHRIGQMTL